MPDRSHASTAMFESQLALVLDTAYGTALHMTRNREAAEDIVQNAALKAFRYYHTFKAGTNFKAWFFRILINCFRQEYRKAQHTPPITTLEDAPELYLYMRAASSGALSNNSDPATLILSRISQEEIQEALAALPEETPHCCGSLFCRRAFLSGDRRYCGVSHRHSALTPASRTQNAAESARVIYGGGRFNRRLRLKAE